MVVVVDIDRGNDCCAVFGIEARTMRWDVALNIIDAPQLFASCRVSLKVAYYPKLGERCNLQLCDVGWKKTFSRRLRWPKLPPLL